jgi:hypothetical protein
MKSLNSTSPEEMYVALKIAFYGGQDLLEWVRATPHLDAHADDWEVAELISANRNIADDVEQSVKRYYRIYGRYWEKIIIPSDYTEKMAQRLLAKRLEEYLRGECKPIDVCSVLQRFEIEFDYPGWLGNLYGACSWVEPETISSDCLYLGEVSAKLLPTLLNS